MQTTVTCQGNGGVGPYQYLWEFEDKALECQREQCSVFISTIGNHTVFCSIVDSANTTVRYNISLSVVKEKIELSSIVGLGDSLTYGATLANPTEENWLALFDDSKSNSELHNFAVSGARTQEVISSQIPKLESMTLDEKSIVFLWIGANDILSQTPPEQFATEYAQIADELARLDAYIIVITVPDFSELEVTRVIGAQINQFASLFGIQVDVPAIAKRAIRINNAVIVELAKEHDFMVIDTFTLLDEFSESDFAEDEFHPNKQGQEKIVKIVEEKLEELYPKTEFV